MEDEKLSFLGDEKAEPQEADAPEAPEEAEVTEAEEAPEEPAIEADAEDTVPADDQAETGEAEQTVAPPATPTPEPQHIPVTALLDEREKRQEAERKAQAMQAQIDQIQRQQQQPAPDWLEDPEGAAKFQQQAYQQQISAMRHEQSKYFAEREFGADAVAEAMAWYDRNPALSHQFVNHPSPFHAAVEFYQKQAFLEKIDGSPDAYIDAEVERRIQERMAQAQPVQQQPQKAPPPSMAAATNVGRDSIQPGNAFDDMFG